MNSMDTDKPMVQRECNDNADDNDCTSTDSDDSDNPVDRLMFLPVSIANLKVSALLDSGSSLNVLSESMLAAIQQRATVQVNPTQFPKMTVASDHQVTILGTVKVKISSQFGSRST